MAKRFRCWRCNSPFGFEFVADGPKCPSCSAGPPAVIPLVSVHYFALTPGGVIKGGDGLQYSIACNPTLMEYGRRSLSSEPTAVTCPACKETPAFQQAFDLAANGDTD